MDFGAIGTLAEIIGMAGAAYCGGVKGGRKAFRAIEERVNHMYAFLVERFGMPQTPTRANGNGKAVTELGLTKHDNGPTKAKESDRMGLE